MNPSILLYNGQGFILKWIFHHGWKKCFRFTVFRLLKNTFCETPFALAWSLVSHVEQSSYKFVPTNFFFFFFGKSLPLLPWKCLPKLDWKQEELTETRIYMKDNFVVRYCITVHFLRKVSFEQHNEFQFILSLWVRFFELVVKIYFLSNLQSWNPLNYPTISFVKYLYCISPHKSVVLILHLYFYK